MYASVLDVRRCADLFFGGYGRILYWLRKVLRPFSVFFGVGYGTLCRSVPCMLRYWIRDAVPICFLYASVLDVERCADLFFRGYGRILYWMRKVLRPFSVCFGVGCGTLCRFFLYIVFFLALGRMYIRFYSLLSAVEFPAGDVAAVWAAAEEV